MQVPLRGHHRSGGSPLARRRFKAPVVMFHRRARPRWFTQRRKGGVRVSDRSMLPPNTLSICSAAGDMDSEIEHRLGDKTWLTGTTNRRLDARPPRTVFVKSSSRTSKPGLLRPDHRRRRKTLVWVKRRDRTASAIRQDRMDQPLHWSDSRPPSYYNTLSHVCTIACVSPRVTIITAAPSPLLVPPCLKKDPKSKRPPRGSSSCVRVSVRAHDAQGEGI
jgi:hypothetical protein